MNRKSLRAQTKLDTTMCPEKDDRRSQESCTVPVFVSPVNTFPGEKKKPPHALAEATAPSTISWNEAPGATHGLKTMEKQLFRLFPHKCHTCSGKRHPTLYTHRDRATRTPTSTSTHTGRDAGGEAEMQADKQSRKQRSNRLIRTSMGKLQESSGHQSGTCLTIHEVFEESVRECRTGTPRFTFLSIDSSVHLHQSS